MAGAKTRFSFIILLTFLAVLIGAAVFVWMQFFRYTPEISLHNTPKYMGAETDISFSVANSGHPVSLIRVELVQGTNQKVLMEQAPKTPAAPSGKGPSIFKLKVNAVKLGFTQGPASLIIQARGRSMGNLYQGTRAEKEIKLTVDTTPPKLTILSRVIRVNRGGTGLAIYNLSKDAVNHGVTIGARRFTGVRPWQDKPELGLCYFAFSQDEDRNAAMQAWAKDDAGNSMKVNLPVRLRWKKYRHDNIKLSNRTIGALAGRFPEKNPDTKNGEVPAFVYINTKMRDKNDNMLKAKAAGVTPEQLWQKTFLRPRGKPMAGFGDRRTYFFNGKEISKAVHLGVDLADVARSPIRASAKGKVVFAGEAGIYGNCVILDHGQGVHSLYAHLSAANVDLNQEVERGDVLGPSGQTGLALGDHLHFSILVGGVFVRPAEWWDPHWIQDNIKIRFKEAGLVKD